MHSRLFKQPSKLLKAAFALLLFVTPLSPVPAQESRRAHKPEPLSITSTISTIGTLGSSILMEASKLLETDPYWQFRGARYSNAGLMSERDEVQLGEKLNIEVGKKFQFVSEGQARANRIGQRVARSSLRPNLTYTFHIIRGQQLNAFSGPGGHIYITTALMNLATDEELASVLSHEVSHVVARHSLKTIQQSNTLGGLADLFGSITGLAGATAQEMGTAAARIVASGLLAVHNREEEREADYLAVRAMAKAGYDPQAMITMFQRILSVGDRDRSLLGAIFADHPDVQERIENTRYEINLIRSGK